MTKTRDKTTNDKTRVAIGVVLRERARLVAEAAAVQATVQPQLDKLHKRMDALEEKAAALAPWREDTPEEERDKAFYRYDGLGVFRGVWMKPQRIVNNARLLEHVDQETIDKCTDELPGGYRVQFYPEKPKTAAKAAKEA